MTVIRIRKVGTLEDVPVESGSFHRARAEVNRGPEAVVRVADGDGTHQAYLTIGADVDIQEGPDAGSVVRQFPGICYKRKRVRGVNGHFLEFSLRHREYHKLRATPCDPYTYSETGASIGDRDAVKVNPWDWRVFRSPFGNVLDADGNPAFVDGVPLEEAVKGLLGTRFVFTHRFEDARLLRASDVLGTPGEQLQVVADNYDDEEVQSLQRVLGLSGYVSNPTFHRLVPLESGDPNVTPMGNLVNVTIRLIGRPDASNNAPIVEVTRRARDGAPTWEPVVLAPTGNINGSGLTLWSGTRVFTGAAGNSLGIRVRVAGAGTADTTRVYWLRVGADLATTDTGLTAGTIETYTDPHALTGAALCVDEDLEGLSRADALERIRQTTIADPAVSRDAHWALYATDNGDLHFKHRRGSDLAVTYQLSDGSITVLEHEDYAEFAAYQVIAEGGGTGDSQFTITDRTEFTAGGLYSAARDPAGVTRLYGGLPQCLVFRDQGTTSRADLRRRARAYFKNYLDPKPFYKLQFPAIGPRPFDVGDGVTVVDPVLGINTVLSIAGVKVNWDAQAGHTWDVDVGFALQDPKQAMASGNLRGTMDKKAPILGAGTKPTGGPGVYFDAAHYGRGSFTIPEGVDVDRVILSMRTLPWQIYSRGGDSEEHDHPTGDVSVGLGGSGSNLGEDPFSLGLDNNWNADQAAFADYSSVFAPAVSANTELDYVEVFLGLYNNNTGLHECRPEFRVVRANGAYSGEVVASQNLSAVAHSVPVQNGPFGDGEDTIFTAFRVSLYKVTAHPILTTDTFKLQYKSTSVSGGSWTDESVAYVTFFYQHRHQVSVGLGGAHIHPNLFGIWQFDGDSGDGNGIPLYGEGIRFAVDPGIDVNGEPTNFTADAHPEVFGDRDGSVKVRIDVTNYLRKDASGRIAPGEHEVIFLATTYLDNDQGLAVVSVTADVKAAEANG